MQNIKLFYDLETTGVHPHKNGIHQIAGIIDIDGLQLEEFDIRMQPHPRAKIEPKALEVGGVTMEDLASYQTMEQGLSEFKTILNKYVNPYDKNEKFHRVGYNNRGFDDIFLSNLFLQNGDSYFGSYFWVDSVDVMVLASYCFCSVRNEFKNFKLATVAKYLGLDVSEGELHDGLYDIELTRDMYYMLKNRLDNPIS